MRTAQEASIPLGIGEPFPQPVTRQFWLLQLGPVMGSPSRPPMYIPGAIRVWAEAGKLGEWEVMTLLPTLNGAHPNA